MCKFDTSHQLCQYFVPESTGVSGKTGYLFTFAYVLIACVSNNFNAS